MKRSDAVIVVLQLFIWFIASKIFWWILRAVPVEGPLKVREDNLISVPQTPFAFWVLGTSYSFLVLPNEVE